MQTKTFKLQSLQKEAQDALLTDDFKKAQKILTLNPGVLDLLLDLMNKVNQDLPPPLEKLKAPFPHNIISAVSFTCGLGCEMCNAGFSDRKVLFDDYKYVSPEQFNELDPWIEVTSSVGLVGLGETMDSPYIYDYLKKVRDKYSFITTSGVSLTQEKVLKLIDCDLNEINFSFDGKTSAGHGSGKEAYVKNFWEKIGMIQNLKEKLGLDYPNLVLTITIDRENFSHLEEIFQGALDNGINTISMNFMFPNKPSLLEKSVFTNFSEVKIKVNQSMKKYNEMGMSIRISEKDHVEDDPKECGLVDKHLIFDRVRNKPSICCGLIALPIESENLQPDKFWNSFPFRYFRWLHYQTNLKELPIHCETCWFMNPKKHEVFSKEFYSNGGDNKLPTLMYNRASKKKIEEEYESAENMFLEVIRLTKDISTKGKAYFHLGEIQLKKKNYANALDYFQLTVRHIFEHKLAFSYLYVFQQLIEGGQNLGKLAK